MNNLPQSREAGSAIRRAKGAWQVKRTTLTFDESLRTFCIFIVTNAVAVCSFSKTIIQAREREREEEGGEEREQSSCRWQVLNLCAEIPLRSKVPSCEF